MILSNKYQKERPNIFSIKNTRRTPLKLGRNLKSNTAKNKVEHN